MIARVLLLAGLLALVAALVQWRVVGREPPKAEADRAQKRAEELLTQLGHKRWS